MYSCAIRSSSSVVTPGATAFPASASAPAAIRPAMRIFSMTSGVCTQGSLPSRAVGLPTYSGRGIDLGTGSVGDSTPGDSAARTGMPPAYWRSGRHSGRAAFQPGPARPADDDRSTHHPTGQHHVRSAFGRGVLAAVGGAADVDLDVVDRGAGTVGQADVDAAEFHV